jgi:DNA-binding transcriptional LysR family regulator
VDLRQLNALLAVAETGSFSAAAGALNTVQSNVSMHVAHLERELGAKLVDRRSGHLTPAGEVVAARARRIQSEIEGLRFDVVSLGHEVRGTARLGMIGTAARWLVPRLLSRCSQRYPGVRLAVVEGTSSNLLTQLEASLLDAALLNLHLHQPGMETSPLFDEELTLVVSTQDPLSLRADLTVADLADLELLLPLPGTAFRDELDAAASAHGVTLRARAEMDGIRLIASLVFEGHGPAILPASAVPRYLRSQWVPIPVEGLPRRHIGVAHRAQLFASPPLSAALSVLRSVVADPTERPDGITPAFDEGPEHAGGATAQEPGTSA